MWIILLGLLLGTLNSFSADLVVFSYNRPMQLYALLESIDKYVVGLNEVNVIIRADSKRYKKSYDVVEQKFSWARFNYQKKPPYDFKPLVMKYSFEEGRSEYIIFAVDDIIVKDYIDLNKCCGCLENYSAYCLPLRLGTNINYCYMLDKKTPLPFCRQVETGLYEYKFADGAGDWAYPNSVDMCLYRKKDIIYLFEKFDWSNPNRLEGLWSSRANLNKKGLFYSESKIVNIPLNNVGPYKNNRNMKSWTAEELLEKFEHGLKVNITPFNEINNNGAHMEYDIEFV